MEGIIFLFVASAAILIYTVWTSESFGHFMQKVFYAIACYVCVAVVFAAGQILIVFLWG